MSRKLSLAAGLVALLGVPALRADDDPKPKKESAVDKAMSQLVELGPGVHKIKMEKGKIVSCVVVGQAPVRTVLGAARGKQVAQRNAGLSANAEFRKWIKTKVKVYESNENEFTMVAEGSKEGEETARREAGKEVDKSTAKYEVAAEGLVRGLQKLGSDVNEKDKTFTVVYGWSAKTSAATKKVDEDLQDDDKSAKKEKDEDDKKGKKKPKGKPSEDDKIGNKRTTSDDLKKFID